MQLYLLNIDNCSICEYTGIGWSPAGVELNCLKCEDGVNCLKILPKVDEETGTCTASMVLTNYSPVFSGSPVSITQLVIADNVQMLDRVGQPEAISVQGGE